MEVKTTLKISIVMFVILLSLFLIASVQSLSWTTPPKSSNSTSNNFGNSSHTETFSDTFSVTTSGGNAIQTSNTTYNYEIERIVVTPSNPSTSYHFSVNELTTSLPIDVDRIEHTGKWDIYKNSPIQNDKIVVHITSASPDDTFTINVIYLGNMGN